VKAESWKMQAALSVQAAIAPFRLPDTLTRRARPPVFPPVEGGGKPGADGTDHPNPSQPARSRGSALQSWPDSGMSRLHRIGGRWDEGAAGLKPVTLRPGILIAWSFHREALPWGADPVCPARHPLEAGFERSRTAVRLPPGQAVGVDGGVRSRVVPAPAADASFR
jgi:hypothetical protein